MENQIISINLIPNLSTPAVVRVSQYDVGRPLVFKVYDGTSPADLTGVTAVIEGTKKSGLGFSESGTVADNTVTLDTTLAMTQEDGAIPAEIRFTKTGEDVGTANFILAVEKSPHLEGTTDGTTETMADLQSQLDALDTRVDALEAGQGGGSGLTDDVKNALLQIAQKVAYIDANGQDYYDDLYDALYNDTTRSVLLVLSHVSSSNTQSTVEVGDSYTTTLTASTNYTINSVSVTMGGVDITSTAYSSGTVSIPSVSGNIVITATAVVAAQSITATYTQSGTVYTTDSLDSLKADLVVTANYSGGTSETVPASNYTLSGTLTEGTSTITVNYAGLTDTFSVTVTRVPNYVRDGLQGYWDFSDVEDGYFGELTNLAVNGDLKAEALYAHNVSGGVPFAGVKDGEFISTTSRVSSAATKHCPTAIRVSTVANHPVFYMAYPYSVEWYGKFVGGSFNGTEYGTQFQYATASAEEPVLINTRNNADPTTSAFNVGGQGTTVTVQNGSYKTYGAAGAGNNTITHANMSPENYHHYVITVAKTSIKIYVDGDLIGEGTATNNNNASAAYGLLLGMHTSIKMVRVYNKILSAEEVATNYSDVS